MAIPTLLLPSIIVNKMPVRIAVIYTHFPHYRAPVFEALSKSEIYSFEFFYDAKGIDETIRNGTLSANYRHLPVKSFRGFMWQKGVTEVIRNKSFDGFIFLGNPYVVSTWFASILARLLSKPVFFWTHGWLKPEHGVKATVRRVFYRLADGLLVYGRRAKEIGRVEGFPDASIHVVYNSMNYREQVQARGLVSKGLAKIGDEANLGKYFLTAGRLIESLELDLAIKAMSHLSSSATLVVVGGGPQQGSLEAEAAALNVDVRFLGPVYDEERLAALFMNACAVVSPGKVGLLAMHALGYGAPVITHDDLNQQMPEVEAIVPGETGAFFRKGDVNDLARQMAFYLRLPSTSRSVCRSTAIETIEKNYTPEAQVVLIEAALNTQYKVRS